MVYIQKLLNLKLDVLKKIEQIAELDGVSSSEIIREALHEYLMKRN